ncbi:MAG TPA: translation initiation factor IF-3 [Anaerolineales bacterium]|nr:translation initiation factor IF-3 [Anaerolineales bacterium]
MSTTDFRVNEGIRVAEVRLIGPDGSNVGVVPIRQALQIARDAELDLVEVSPNANPPVCRVIDYGKFIYERAKKEREAKRAQTKIEVKEIRLRPKTNEAHRGFKVDDARRWLLQGHKVRVTIKFRGREMDYPEIALEDLKEIATALADVASIEVAPQMEGRTMLVVMAPNKGAAKKKEKGEQPEGRAQAPAEKAEPQASK